MSVGRLNGGADRRRRSRGTGGSARAGRLVVRARVRVRLRVDVRLRVRVRVRVAAGSHGERGRHRSGSWSDRRSDRRSDCRSDGQGDDGIHRFAGRHHLHRGGARKVWCNVIFAPFLTNQSMSTSLISVLETKIWPLFFVSPSLRIE